MSVLAVEGQDDWEDDDDWDEDERPPRMRRSGGGCQPLRRTITTSQLSKLPRRNTYGIPPGDMVGVRCGACRPDGVVANRMYFAPESAPAAVADECPMRYFLKDAWHSLDEKDCVTVLEGTRDFEKTTQALRRDGATVAMCLIYAPWCGHCHEYVPEYIEHAPYLSKDMSIFLVNGDDSTGEPFEPKGVQFQGFPTLIMFNPRTRAWEPWTDSRKDFKLMRSKACAVKKKHSKRRKNIDFDSDDDGGMLWIS
jgi:hypothetical protein